MMSKDPFNDLDYILNHLATCHYTGAYQSADSIRLDIEIDGCKLNSKEFRIILDKLLEDKYVSAKTFDVISGKAQQQYRINFSGYILHLSGGYASKNKRETNQANLQFWQTWAIVIGTFFAGLYGIIEVCKVVKQWFQ